MRVDKYAKFGCGRGNVCLSANLVLGIVTHSAEMSTWMNAKICNKLALFNTNKLILSRPNALDE